MLFPHLLAFSFLQEPAPSGAQGAAAQGTAPATPPASGDSPWSGMLIPMLLCAVVVYFFMIAPERKTRKKREQMLGNLQKGAKVMTSGGLYGTVNQVQDGVVTLQIADGVRVRYAVSAIQQVLEDETAKDEKSEKSDKDEKAQRDEKSRKDAKDKAR